MAQTNPDGVANSIEKITLNLIGAMDNVFAHEAKTNSMTANPLYVDASARSKTVKVASAVVNGAGNYDPAKGWPVNTGSLTWEDYTLQYDRGTSFLIDALETAQTDGIASASLMASEFFRTQMIPEIDAVRIAKVAKKASDASQSISTAPTKKTILSQIVEGLDGIYDRTGIDSGITIYINNTYKSMLDLSEEITRTKNVESTGETISTRATNINGNPVVFVPSSRMYSDVTVNAGDTDTGGYKPAGNAVNFLLVAPQCAQGITSYSNVTVLPRGSHSRGDGDFWAYRVYYDCIVPKNKVGGLYVSLGSAVGE